MKIAICITTRNRPEVFDKTYQRITNHFPLGVEAKRFVVDDASDRPVPFTSFRFEKRAGVARAKNKCLELAYDWGADHIFLFDDDTMPIRDGWWMPYVTHPEPHLMYQFKLQNRKNDMRELYRDEETAAYTHTRGCMIYIERRVLDVVGGMDTRYGLAYYEHPDWTNRIHNAGLTTHRAMDIPDSNNFIYCLDQNQGVKSSIEPSLKRQANRQLYLKSKTSKEYREFKS